MTREFAVIDASVIGPLLTDDTDDGDRVRSRLADVLMWAPGVIDLEVLSLLRTKVKLGGGAEARARLALADLPELRLRRVGTQFLHARIWQLRDNLTPYDAAYVAVAERLRAPLITADAKLAGAPGPTCPIELLR